MTADRWAPEPTALTAEFWESTRRAEYLVQWCARCDVPIYYPRHACPQCLGDDLPWRPSPGTGAVYSFTVVRVPAAPWMVGRTPYIAALVDLDEGVRVLTNVVTDDFDAVHVGMRVGLWWESLPDGRALPLFTPVGD